MASPFVLILGTGSGDIDTQIALKFAPQYPIAIICDAQNDLGQTVKLVRDTGGEIALFKTDFSTNEHLSSSITTVTNHFGKRCAMAIFQLRNEPSPRPFLEQAGVDNIRKGAVLPIAAAYAFAQQTVSLLLNHADGSGHPPTLVFAGTSGTSYSDEINDNALVALSRGLGREFGKKSIHVCHVKYKKGLEASSSGPNPQYFGTTAEAVPNERRRHRSDHHEQDIEIDPSPHECPFVAVSEPCHVLDNDINASSYIQTFPESSFFKEGRASTLPSLGDVRAIIERPGNIDATKFNHPPPVKFPSLGLFVKYGADAAIIEAQAQIMLCEKLQGRLPVPEVFGWAQNGGQNFIYMALVEGQTLMDRWGDLNGDEKQVICEELRDMVKMSRALKQDTGDEYIGSLGKQPSKDMFLEHYPNVAGPFCGSNAIEHSTVLVTWRLATTRQLCLHTMICYRPIP